MNAYPFKAHIFGRLVVTWCRQGGNAPFIDRAWTRDREGRRYRSLAILLTPWRREYGHSAPQPALVIGWRETTKAKAEGTACADEEKR